VSVKRTLIAAAAIAAAILTAAATPAAATQTPGEQIAAALRESPLYVDPSLSWMFPAAGRVALLKAIRKSPIAVFVLAIPVSDQWSSDQQLAAVVHNYLGQDGVYLMVDYDGTYGGNGPSIEAYTWPSDPQGDDAPPYHAADAAHTQDLSLNPVTSASTMTLPQMFLGCIQLITDGQAVSAYNAEESQIYSQPAAAPPPKPGDNNGLLIALIVLASIAAVAGTGTLLLTRRPRFKEHPVLAKARKATESKLRAQAQQQVIELGELVKRPGPDGGEIVRALDAYYAAGKVLDRAGDLPDLAGVVVLADLGRKEVATARALEADRPVPPVTPLCFFNPLHGEAAEHIRWRPLGELRTLDVHACRECADATAQHCLPDALTDRNGTPYYEGDSIWAATGYGQFSADLTQRILTNR
jgi:hypothetical protein